MQLKAAATIVPLFVEQGPLFVEQGPDGVVGIADLFWLTLLSKMNGSLGVEFIGLLDLGALTSSTDGTGIMGSLIRNETQFSVIPLYMDQLAVEYLDYTAAIAQEDWVILSGPPKKFHSDHLASLSSFQNSLWIAVTCALFAFSSAWSLLLTIKKYFKFRLQLLLFEFQNCLFSSFKSLINQDINYIGHFYERLCVIAWVLSAFNLSVAFTGVMFSKLAKADDPFRYETLEDFLTHPIKLILIEGTPPYNDIKNSKHPTAVKIRNSIFNRDTAITTDTLDPFAAFDDMSLGNSAYIMFKRAVLIFSSQFCGHFRSIYFSKKPLYATMFTVYFRKDIRKEFKNIIKKTVHQFFESKVLERKLNQLAYHGELCVITKEEELTMPLSVQKFYFILIFYCFSMVVASCCLIVEISLYFRASQNARRQNNPRSNRNLQHRIFNHAFIDG